MSNRISLRWTSVGWMALVAVAASSPAGVCTAAKYWKTSVVNGAWSTGTNWSAFSAAGVDNAGVPFGGETVNIDLADGVSRTITYDYTGPATTLANLVLDQTAVGAATTTLSMSANNLTSQAEYIGFAPEGSAVFNQSGGVNTIAAGSGFLDVGVFGGSTGTYNLSGTGALVANTPEYIGDVGTGFFNQTGGTNTIQGGHSLYLGYNAVGTSGTYTLSGGALAVNNNGFEYIGFRAPGTFNHSGGTNTASAIELGGSAGVTGSYSLSGSGSVSAFSVVVGSIGIGAFNQSGESSLASSNLFLGGGAGSSGAYALSGGSMLVEGNESIGNGGTGTFTQTGGTNLTNGSLHIGVLAGSSGTYNISGGSASVASTFVGGSNLGPGGTGVLNVSGTGVLTINGNLHVVSRPGNAVNLSGGTINTAWLDFRGTLPLLNWTSGKLHLTQGVTWDPAGSPTSLALITGAAFGSSRTLGNTQTLMVTGNETLGGNGTFALTLNSGSAHIVTGTLTISPTGTLTQNAGGTLYATTLTHAGGTVNGTLQNQGLYHYQSGQFNGRLLNQGTVLFGPSLTLGNGVQNEAILAVAAGQTLTVNGAGLDNLGTLTLAGGVISGSGPVLNNFGGTLQAHGTINPTFTNNGLMQVDGVLRFNGAAATNNGVVRGNGTVMGSFANAAGGTIELTQANLLAVVGNIDSNSDGNIDWTNAGFVALDSGAVLGGSQIVNTGTISGAGTVNSRISNNGVIRAEGGQLSLGAVGTSTSTTAQIQASTGNTVMVLQGLAVNSGTISLTGGAFDNNNRPLSNGGTINGYGVLRTSTMTNSNKVNVGEGNMDVLGSVVNTGTIGIQGGRSAYFFGAVSGAGSFTGVGTAVFLAAVSPGSSPAAVSFGGNVTLASSSSLALELGGATPGVEYDQLLVAGALSLGGPLNVSLINGYMPALGQTFNLLDWGSLAGSFSAINLPALPVGRAWNVAALYTSGVISVTPSFLEADFDENGTVNAADLGRWKTGFGALGAATHMQGDADGDLDVDGNDFLIWQRQLGSSRIVAATAAVPEPACGVILLVVAAWTTLSQRSLTTRRA